MKAQMRSPFRFLSLLLLLLSLVVLQGGREVCAAEEESEPEEGETADGWDDVLDALEPFYKEKGELCASCEFVARRINAKIISKRPARRRMASRI